MVSNTSCKIADFKILFEKPICSASFMVYKSLCIANTSIMYIINRI